MFRFLLEVLMTQVAAGIIFQNGSILVTRRGPGEKHAGCWEFPGGKLEASETFQQCIEREILEVLEPLLEGGVASLKITICGPEQLGV